MPPRHAAYADVEWSWDLTIFSTHGDTLFVPAGWGHDVTTTDDRTTHTPHQVRHVCLRRVFLEKLVAKLLSNLVSAQKQPPNVTFVIGWHLREMERCDTALQAWLVAPRLSTRYNVAMDILSHGGSRPVYVKPASIRRSVAIQTSVIARARRECASDRARQRGCDSIGRRMVGPRSTKRLSSGGGRGLSKRERREERNKKKCGRPAPPVRQPTRGGYREMGTPHSRPGRGCAGHRARTLQESLPA